MTRIYLVRHAHAVWTPDDKRPLSESGAADAQRVAERLGVHPITAIYSSPSLRAIQTVAPLAQQLGLTPRIVRDLRERALPKTPVSHFEGVIRAMWDAPDQEFYGESHVAAQRRAMAVINDIAAHDCGAEVVVSTHGTLLSLILNAIDVRFDFNSWARLTFPDVYRVTFGEGGAVGFERIWEAAPSTSGSD